MTSQPAGKSGLVTFTLRFNRNRLAGCYDFITTCISMFAAILHGFTCANFGTHDGQGRNKVRFDKFLQRKKSAPGEVFCGVQADATGGHTLTNEAQLRGAFAYR